MILIEAYYQKLTHNGIPVVGPVAQPRPKPNVVVFTFGIGFTTTAGYDLCLRHSLVNLVASFLCDRFRIMKRHTDCYRAYG